MSRGRQLIAGFLALCLALAGAVAVNPVLHQWVEHGGRGGAHVHFSGGAAGDRPASHFHDGHHHSHAAIPESGRGSTPASTTQSGLFVPTTRPFELPAGFGQVWQWVARAFAADSPETEPMGDQPGHEHHSLVQSLAAGTVELHAELPCLGLVQRFFPPIGWHPNTVLREHAWDLQTAGRGPPVLAG